MVDITSKSNSLRKATAVAIVSVSKQETVDAVRNKKIPKGDVFEFSRAAGLLAIKKTSDVIPDCHPLPIEYAAIKHELDGLNIIITVEVHTIYKTGVEVEAMHGAGITALTIYDMLKPIDKGVEISSIKLIHKKGGKSDFSIDIPSGLSCAVIVCSDSISKGEGKDTAGEMAIKRLKEYGLQTIDYKIIPDDISIIQNELESFVGANIDLILFTGGTGLSSRDVTPEAILPLIEISIPGIMETFRHYGQERTPYAMLSRGIAGFIKNSLVITLPGSPGAMEEAMNSLFPQIFHVFKVRSGFRH
jgi:cyclic pyranopterin monophosphate synthase